MTFYHTSNQSGTVISHPMRVHYWCY